MITGKEPVNSLQAYTDPLAGQGQYLTHGKNDGETIYGKTLREFMCALIGRMEHPERNADIIAEQADILTTAYLNKLNEQQ